jgi:hypothetical protein
MEGLVMIKRLNLVGQKVPKEKRYRKPVLLFFVCCVILLLFYLVPRVPRYYQALHSGNTLGMFELGKAEFQNGNYRTGVYWLYSASKRAVIVVNLQDKARPYLLQTEENLQHGQLKEALAACNKVRDIFGSYDDEGGFAYKCLMIQRSM